LAECTRHDGEIDEADAVELCLTDIGMHREELRGHATILKRLGYIAVANRLRQMARKAKRAPPRPSWLARNGHTDG
jgi:hypothetical protein